MTLLVTWTHASSVGVRAMDNEHSIMMDVMNELRSVLAHGAEREQAKELLSKLIEITGIHFWNEEQLMERYGFPGLGEHRTEHQRLLEHLKEFAHRRKHGEVVHMSGFLCFLHNWFIDHVEGLDKQYGPWLNKHGVY
jgi:hemerythrin-like metal-binding protein